MVGVKAEQGRGGSEPPHGSHHTDGFSRNCHRVAEIQCDFTVLQKETCFRDRSEPAPTFRKCGLEKGHGKQFLVLTALL